MKEIVPSEKKQHTRLYASLGRLLILSARMESDFRALLLTLPALGLVAAHGFEADNRRQVDAICQELERLPQWPLFVSIYRQQAKEKKPDLARIFWEGHSARNYLVHELAQGFFLQSEGEDYSADIFAELTGLAEKLARASLASVLLGQIVSGAIMAPKYLSVAEIVAWAQADLPT